MEKGGVCQTSQKARSSTGEQTGKGSVAVARAQLDRESREGKVAVTSVTPSSQVFQMCPPLHFAQPRTQTVEIITQKALGTATRAHSWSATQPSLRALALHALDPQGPLGQCSPLLVTLTSAVKVKPTLAFRVQKNAKQPTHNSHVDDMLNHIHYTDLTRIYSEF